VPFRSEPTASTVLSTTSLYLQCGIAASASNGLDHNQSRGRCCRVCISGNLAGHWMFDSASCSHHTHGCQATQRLKISPLLTAQTNVQRPTRAGASSDRMFGRKANLSIHDVLYRIYAYIQPPVHVTDISAVDRFTWRRVLHSYYRSTSSTSQEKLDHSSTTRHLGCHISLTYNRLVAAGLASRPCLAHAGAYPGNHDRTNKASGSVSSNQLPTV
jgi:hypothetical protein